MRWPKRSGGEFPGVVDLPVSPHGVGHPHYSPILTEARRGHLPYPRADYRPRIAPNITIKEREAAE
ncbi:hypothetical protein [Mycobacterium malmoense]|uniref:hypothetical protein n=1 Tax=Mycobacterium malmoense TaxID=1780 RepID=UPI0008F84FDA|nr:hypothetical protein [Mycobacterium malmoense]OIN79318.1 hypothetical protein BMG05_18700 [Mycobacterium malmoense]